MLFQVPLLILASVIVAYGTENVAWPQSIKRTNYGVIFNSAGVIDVTPSVWHVTFVVPMPETYTELPNLVENICTTATTQNADESANGQGKPRNREPLLIDKTDISLQRNIGTFKLQPVNSSEENEDNQKLLSEICHLFESYTKEKRIINKAIQKSQDELNVLLPLATDRSTRALLGFLGHIAQDLTGVALLSDVNNINKHINAYQQLTKENRERILQIGESIGSITEIQAQNAELLKKAVLYGRTRTDAIAKNLQGDIDNVRENLTNLILNLHYYGVLEIEALRDIYSNFNQYKEAAEALLKGKLHKFLVPIHTMQETLHHIAEHLPSYGKFQLVHKQIETYYLMKYVTFSRIRNTLFVQISVPIASEESLFYLYQVHTMPMLITPQHTQRSKISLINEFFGISADKKRYITMSDQQLHSCRGEFIRRCTVFPLATKWSKPSCPLAIYEDDVDLIQRYCDVIIVDDHEGLQNPVAWRLDEEAHYLLSNVRNNNLTVQCENGHESVKLLDCDPCIVVLPCHCRVESTDFMLAASLDSCNTTNEVVKLHPLNLAALANFIPVQHLRQFNSKTFLKSPPITTIPEIKIISKDMNGVLTKETTGVKSLKKLAEEIKKGHNVYESMSSKLVSQLGLMANEVVAKSTPIISWVALIIATMSLLFTVYANCRIMAFVPFTHAFDLRFEEAKSTPLAPEEDKSILENISPHVYHHSGTAIILIVTIILVLIVRNICNKIIERQEKDKENPIHTRIILALYDDTDVITFPLLVCPIKADKIKSVPVGRIFNKPILSFNKIMIKWNVTVIGLTLPDRIKINLFTEYFTTRKILSNLRHFRLVAIQGDNYYQLHSHGPNQLMRKIEDQRQRNEALRRFISMRAPKVRNFNDVTPSAPCERELNDY